MWWFGYLKQDSAGLQVSDSKSHKVNVIYIVFRFTEVPCNKNRQLTGVTTTEMRVQITIDTVETHKNYLLKHQGNMQNIVY